MKTDRIYQENLFVKLDLEELKQYYHKISINREGLGMAHGPLFSAAAGSGIYKLNALENKQVS